MIKFIGEFEWYNKKSAALDLEHIAQLISQGYDKGMGWRLEGEEEKEIINEDEL